MLPEVSIPAATGSEPVPHGQCWEQKRERGKAGTRTLIDRLTAGCSTFELPTHVGFTHELAPRGFDPRRHRFKADAAQPVLGAMVSEVTGGRGLYGLLAAHSRADR